MYVQHHMKTLLQKYQQLEEINAHSAAAKLLVDNFGTEEEKEIMNRIIKRHKANGFIGQDDYELRYKISQKYYNVLIKTAKPS